MLLLGCQNFENFRTNNEVESFCLVFCEIVEDVLKVDDNDGIVMDDDGDTGHATLETGDDNLVVSNPDTDQR